MPESPSSLKDRVAFVTELAHRLHQYGTTAPRLEDAVTAAAGRLGLRCEVWSSPTALILAFYDAAAGDDAMALVTQVLRLAPGDVNLRQLSAVDQIADDVIDGRVDVKDGRAAIRALAMPLSWRWRWALVLNFGVAAAGIAVLFRLSWADAIVAGVLGVVIGWITFAGGGHPRLAAASDALGALVVTFVAIIVSAYLIPLSVKGVVLSALIVLVPGFSLTTAVRELSSQHLVSGTARFAGSMTTMLKLIFGVVAASEFCHLFGVYAPANGLPAVAAWTEAPAVIVCAVSFAVLFQAALRDWLIVILAVAGGYVVARFAGVMFNSVIGVFLGGLAVGAASNAYARWAARPGALVREPGIILLVPGSVGFRSISSLLENAVGAGADTGILLVKLLAAVVAGLLFGDLLIRPRRIL